MFLITKEDLSLSLQKTVMEKYLRLYRYVFWTGYFAVLIATFLPISFRVEKIRLGPEAFSIRTDHLLHFTVYFLKCMFYLFGERKGLILFDKNPLKRFILLVMILATVTEVAQIWVPARAFNIFDWVANMAGILAGWGIIRIAGKR